MQVTSYDPVTGDSVTSKLDPNSYILVTGEFCEVTNVTAYATGTTTITMKRKKP